MRRTPSETVSRFTQKAREVLQGRTIKSVRYMEPEELDSFGWSRAGLVLVLDNGTTLIVQQDDEGNGPGAIWYDAQGTQGILPVI